MVRPQTAQLFLKMLFHAFVRFHQIMRQFGRDFHLVTTLISLQDLSEDRFAARINVSRIEIIDTAGNGCHDFPFRFDKINATKAILAESHTTISQYRNVFSTFILPILHVAHSYPTPLNSPKTGPSNAILWTFMDDLITDGMAFCHFLNSCHMQNQ